MRNIYLTGAKEIEEGIKPLPMAGGRNSDLAKTLSKKDWFDAFALRLNPGRARGVDLSLQFVIDSKVFQVTVNRQVENAKALPKKMAAMPTIVLSQAKLEELADNSELREEFLHVADLSCEDRGKFKTYFDLHDNFDLWFPIVTP